MQDNWSKLFTYKGGKLFWNDLQYKGFVYGGKEAGWFNKGYLWIRSKYVSKITPVHRIIWELHFGKIPENMVIDHKDGNGQNNEISNLRLATRSQNSMNAQGKSNSVAKLPKNVYVDYSTQSIVYYRAQICAEGIYHRKGKLTLNEAVKEAEKLRKIYHKDFEYKGESYEV